MSSPSGLQLTRRGLLEAGSLGVTGICLPQLLAADRITRDARARSCILFFMEGGPAHQDMWDMKPHAPVEYRGEFKPIASSLTGVPVCEHLPLLSRQMHHFALIRSVQHTINDHNAGSYYMLTGRAPLKSGGLITRPEPDNFPPFGSVLARLRPVNKPLPPFVHMPDIMFNNGANLPGQNAGFLRGAYDPLVAGDPSVGGYQLPGLALRKGLSHHRLRDRHALLAAVNVEEMAGLGAPRWHRFQSQALDLLSSSATHRAFDLSRENHKTRRRYGLPGDERRVPSRKFGGLPHLGQCLLAARRLVEAGVRLVTVCAGRRFDQSWDGHREHFPLMKRSLLPHTDRALSALLEDLQQRDLLGETLVVAMGEFGRTPKMGQITSSAGATPGGRDHWPHCYSVLMAGAGIRGGAIHGASDQYAAYPSRDPCTPEDIAATIYHLLGIPPETRIHDRLHRPHTVALGQPLHSIFA